ncbi:MAG: hypothetical protein JW702_04675 [Clostridiales bacterium]|nr:hypothetical protein [Clostridiales bacterium]
MSIVLLISGFSVVAMADTKDVVKQTNLENALENKLTYEFGEYSPGKFDEWMELYNRNEVSYAYLVALYDSKNKIAGFSIVSDINERVLMTAV